MSSFFSRIEERLTELDWKQVKLANRAHMNATSLSRLLRDGNRVPREATIQKLADALGVTVDWLSKGIEPKVPLQMTPDISSEILDNTLGRLHAVVKTYLDYNNERGFNLSSESQTNEITVLFCKSLVLHTYEEKDLRKILTGEVKIELPDAKLELKKLLDKVDFLF